MSGRHSLVALAVGLALAGQAQAQLLITEYLEGSSNNKALELSNLGSDAVDLSQYRLALMPTANPHRGPHQQPGAAGHPGAGASLVLANPPPAARSWPRPIRPAATWCSTVTTPWCSIAAASLWTASARWGGSGHGLGVGRRLDPGHDPAPQGHRHHGLVDATAPFDPALEYVAAPGMTPAVWVAAAMVPAMAPSRPPSSARWISWCPCPPFRAPAAAARWCRPASSSPNRPMPPAAW